MKNNFSDSAWLLSIARMWIQKNQLLYLQIKLSWFFYFNSKEGA